MHTNTIRILMSAWFTERNKGYFQNRNFYNFYDLSLMLVFFILTYCPRNYSKKKRIVNLKKKLTLLPQAETTMCVHGRTTCQPVLTTFPQPRHIATQGYNITQSSAPDDGHIIPETCWATSTREVEALPANRSWQTSRSHGIYQQNSII